MQVQVWLYNIRCKSEAGLPKNKCKRQLSFGEGERRWQGGDYLLLFQVHG